MVMTTRKKKRKRTRKTSGSRLAALVLALLVMVVAPAAAEKKPKKLHAASGEFSLIAGTVYRPPGFALAGAEIEITSEIEGKPTTIKAVSDARGEFALRVGTVPMMYKIGVKRSGYLPQQQTVAIDGEQRKDLTFRLEPVEK